MGFAGVPGPFGAPALLVAHLGGIEGVRHTVARRVVREHLLPPARDETSGDQAVPKRGASTRGGRQTVLRAARPGGRIAHRGRLLKENEYARGRSIVRDIYL